MSLHRITLDTAPFPDGQALTITGDEAFHAVVVKRLQPGDTVEVLDGRGTVATAVVTRTDKQKRDAVLDLTIQRTEQCAPTTPRIEVWSAVPKADRASQMIDQLAQVGAAVWRPLVTERSVTDADHKSDRLRRIAVEASKQCGRAWHLTIDTPRTIDDAVVAQSPRCAVIFADSDGHPPGAFAAADHVIVLVGPEGGFSPGETARLRDSHTPAIRLGPHILRTETAAVAAAAVLLTR